MVLRPATLPEALAMLAGPQEGGESPPVPLAGATDLYPAHVGLPVASTWLDLSRIAALREIAPVEREGRAWLRIGSLVTWSMLRRAAHPLLSGPRFDGLRAAAAEVGGLQIQNRGTLGGNLCHASPAADGVPALLAIDAEVELARTAGSRRLALSDFVLGPRRTARRPDELLTAVWVPLDRAGGSDTRTIFLKLGHRRYLVISAVMLALRLEWSPAGRILDAGAAVGACGPRAVRLPGLAEALAGLDVPALLRFADDCRRTGSQAAATLLAPLSPIDDLRGTREWRLRAAGELLARALELLAADRADIGRAA